MRETPLMAANRKISQKLNEIYTTKTVYKRYMNGAKWIIVGQYGETLRDATMDEIRVALNMQ